MLSKAANGLVDSSGNYTMQADPAGGYSINGILSASSASVSGLVKAGSITVSGNLTAATVAATTVTGFGTIPLGGIIMWSGATTAIPAGWALCNGGTVSGQVTPNLQDKFIVGAGNTYAVGSAGGASAVTLSVNQMPSHKHFYGFAQGSGAAIGDGYAGISGAFTTGNAAELEQSGGNDGQRLQAWAAYTASTGGGAAIDIRPPYYALAYIMRVQ
jgi:microcystin-dependent protein